MESAHRPTQYHQAPRPRILDALDRRAPFWGPQLVVFAALLLDLALPAKITVGPSWLLPSVEGLLLIGLAAASLHTGLHRSATRRYLAIALIALVSAVNVYSVALLCHYLLHGHNESGRNLIFSGIALWGTNVLLYGLWFYELDRGGPLARMCGDEDYPDFLFVQMTDEGLKYYAPPGWTPRLIDYLYTSFTNATAFSPTDTMPLSAAAKWLMTSQSLVSLTIVVLVVARAVNILNG